ncbi:MAG: hypothetical protein ACD_37C00406G0002, partial [uncultured bacterium]
EGVSVGIYPPIIQIDASPPAIVNTQISIQNESDQTINYGIFLMPFKAANTKNGEPEFDKTLLESYKEFFKGVQVSDKNKVISEIKLAPNQTKELTLRIAVPKGMQAKDYYFSVLFITQESQGLKENSFAGARAGIAANVLLTLGPKSKSSGYIREFSAPHFVTRGPVDFTLNLANTSPHYITIEGNVLIKNIFNQTVGSLDLLPVNLLSNSERFIESEGNKKDVPRLYWNEAFLLGIYTADLTVSLSPEGPIVKRSLTFIAIPLELILGLVIGFILIIGIIKRVKRKQIE